MYPQSPCVCQLVLEQYGSGYHVQRCHRTSHMTGVVRQLQDRGDLVLLKIYEHDDTFPFGFF